MSHIFRVITQYYKIHDVQPVVPHLPAGQSPAAGVSAKLLDEDGQEGDSGWRGRRGSSQQGPDMRAMFDDLKVSTTAKWAFNQVFIGG